MEQTKGRKAFCIGLSILIALLVWFYANGDTEIEISVNDVPIEFTNEDTTLADKGLMLLSNEEETIDLELSMPRSTYFKLDPGKIRIVVDLSSVTTTGTQTITYSILYPRGPRGELLSSSITQREPTVRSTTIEIGELFRQEGIELRYEAGDEDLPPIPGDPERLKQVFCNVLDNAAKHGGAGKRIDASIVREGGEQVVRVRDYGPGVPEEELPYVKQKFYKGSSKARGSGIGLAVCDEIVKLHGGTFEIGNAEGGGAVVTIRLPSSE